MQNQRPSDFARPIQREALGTTSRIVGVLYLAGMVVGIGGNILSNPFLVDRITSRRLPRTACCWQSEQCSG